MLDVAEAYKRLTGDVANAINQVHYKLELMPFFEMLE